LLECLTITQESPGRLQVWFWDKSEFSTTGTIVNTTVALLSGFFGDWLQTRPRFSQFQQWFTGSVFVALGTSIALPERK